MTRWQQFLDWLGGIFGSRYVRLLEEENAQLKAENRALINSLLGTAGIPPLELPEARAKTEIPRLRRRSWHQIAAQREFAAAARAESPAAAAERTRPDGAPRPGRGPFH